MKMTSYDPDELPKLDLKVTQAAGELHKKIVFIHCVQKHSNEGVSFYTLVDHMPRIGERITLDDNSVCEIKGILHKVTHFNYNGDKLMILVPTIVSMLVKNGKSQNPDQEQL